MDKENFKILFLIDELLIGGTENQLILLAERLPRESFEPVIGVLRETPYQKTLELKTSIENLNWSGAPLVKNFSLLWKIKNYLDKEKFDILQTHFVDSTIYGAWAARLCRKRPYLITTRRNLYYWVEDKPMSFRFLRHTVHWTDRILVNSRKVFEECQRRENIPPEKITLIPNAIEVERFNGISTEEAKKAIRLDGRQPVIGVVANFRPIKGLLSFLDAAGLIARQIPEAQFVLVGKGPQEEELRTRCQELGIQDRVKFLLDYPDIPMAMAAFDVAVQPSLSESFSNVLLEYMAAGKPIVATRVGDAERIIEDEREGLLVNPNNPEGLADAVIELCKNRNKSVQFGKLSQEKVVANWSFEGIMKNYHQLYETIIKDVKSYDIR